MKYDDNGKLINFFKGKCQADGSNGPIIASSSSWPTSKICGDIRLANKLQELHIVIFTQERVREMASNGVVFGNGSREYLRGHQAPHGFVCSRSLGWTKEVPVVFSEAKDFFWMQPEFSFICRQVSRASSQRDATDLSWPSFNLCRNFCCDVVLWMAMDPFYRPAGPIQLSNHRAVVKTAVNDILPWRS